MACEQDILSTTENLCLIWINNYCPPPQISLYLQLLLGKGSHIGKILC